MTTFRVVSLSTLLVGVALSSAARADGPAILSVAKIWDKGKHNAFTDLLRWRDKWYCVFREGDAHVGGDGKLRVLESTDGKAWNSVALVEEDGVDLRDPHLSITPDNRLMMVAGGSVYKGTTTLMGRQPRVTFSADARKWSPPQRVLGEGDWLWRVTWHDGKAYGVSYDARVKKPGDKEPDEWKLRLVTSNDGVDWRLLTNLEVTGRPNETTLRFLPGGEMMALVRREAGDLHGWIGTARAPYKEWRWHETGYRFGGPNFIALPDGSFWASSRRHHPATATTKAKTTTAVIRMSDKSYEPVLELPSGGDTSYAGLVWHEGVLWVSYYSSHEGKSSIYLARVGVKGK